jgi:hypothetical protein
VARISSGGGDGRGSAGIVHQDATAERGDESDPASATVNREEVTNTGQGQLGPDCLGDALQLIRRGTALP